MLLDECVDRRLAEHILGHDVKTVPEAGWAALKNGELLGRAEQEFDVFITATAISTVRELIAKHRRSA